MAFVNGVALVGLNINGLSAVQRIMRESTKAGAKAHRLAVRATVRKIHGDASRSLAAVKEVNLKDVRKRIKTYVKHPRRGTGGLAWGKVWLGVSKGIKDGGKKTMKAITAKSFTATMSSGHTGQFVRVPAAAVGATTSSRWVGHGRSSGVGYRYKGRKFRRPRSSSPNLPIREPQVFLMPEAERILEAAAHEHVIHTYPKEFKRLLKVLTTGGGFSSKKRT